MRCKVRIYKLVILLLVCFNINALAAGEQKAAGVVVTKVKSGEVAETRTFIGLLKFDRVSKVSTEMSGIVNKVYVKQGMRVKKGQVLLVLDTQLLVQDIRSAEANIAKVQVNITNAKRNYDRLKQLYDKKAASQKSYEDAMYSYKSLVQEKNSLSATLNGLKIKLRKSSIRAPFDALVLQKNTEKGDWANPGQALYELASMEDIFVQVAVPETVLRYTKNGTIVDVLVTAYDRQKKGKIYAIEPSADQKTKNVNIKVRIECSKDLAENMSARVDMPVSEKKVLKLIPRDALIKFQGKDFVYTVKDGKAKILPINIVAFKGNMVGVDNPYIVPGMPVVVDGNERLRPDAPAKIVGEK